MIKMEHLPRHTTGLLKEVWDRKHRISEITNLNSNGDTARTIKLMLTGLVCMQCNWTIGVRRPVFSLICLSDLSGWVVCACVALALLLLVRYLAWSADLVERLASLNCKPFLSPGKTTPELNPLYYTFYSLLLLVHWFVIYLPIDSSLHACDWNWSLPLH